MTILEDQISKREGQSRDLIAQLRVLVVIASYGEKNLRFLKQIVSEYHKMSFDADIVVCSEAPKHLGEDVENVVGLPSKNPWTLPFAHKAIFAERADRYDLFIYSEDDILATEDNVRAFLEATSQLNADEIAGFFRYEVEGSGTRRMSEPWAHYHWKPESVKRRGSYTIAEFTNEHAGFYILTKEQLKRVIASGGFLRGPYCGRYSWPETAATDPYTSCGFRKVVCISELEKFLVHHMPNPYVHQLDVSLDSFKEQLGTLFAIRDGSHPVTTLCPVESSQFPRNWEKSYYEKPSDVVLDLVPKIARRILSVGCGWGALEAELIERGAEVVAIPLDSVIGEVAVRRGVQVVYSSLEKGFEEIESGSFDAVVMTNLLHLQQDTGGIVAKLSRVLREDGSLVLSGPNFDRLPWLVKRIAALGEFGCLRDFKTSGISISTPRSLRSAFTEAGMRLAEVRWINHWVNRGWTGATNSFLGQLTARDWVLRAERYPKTSHAS